jgi:hypothetical protein
MTDQPPDQEPTDPRPTTTDQSGEGPVEEAPLTLDEAAAALGISVNAVRQRIKRGTLLGVKSAAGWAVWLPTDQPTTPTIGRRPANQRPAWSQPTTDRPPTNPVDLAPLAELIARQGDDIRRLAEAATAWQIRAMQAEERLQQLTAGDASGATKPTRRRWWHRLGPRDD